MHHLTAKAEVFLLNLHTQVMTLKIPFDSNQYTLAVIIV